jgi:hypothetical protein
MLLRGRPPSQVPAKTAAKLGAEAGLPVSMDDVERGSPEVQNRISGAGALLGYTTGIGVGTLYGLLRPALNGTPLPVAGTMIGAAAMAGGDLPPVRLGLTNPRTWGTSGWLSDIIPHLIYGMVAAAVYQAMIGRGRH